MILLIFLKSDDKEYQKIAIKLKIMPADQRCSDAVESLGNFYFDGTDENLIMTSLYLDEAFKK